MYKDVCEVVEKKTGAKVSHRIIPSGPWGGEEAYFEVNFGNHLITLKAKRVSSGYIVSDVMVSTKYSLIPQYFNYYRNVYCTNGCVDKLASAVVDAVSQARRLANEIVEFAETIAKSGAEVFITGFRDREISFKVFRRFWAENVELVKHGNTVRSIRIELENATTIDKKHFMRIKSLADKYPGTAVRVTHMYPTFRAGFEIRLPPGTALDRAVEVYVDASKLLLEAKEESIKDPSPLIHRIRQAFAVYLTYAADSSVYRVYRDAVEKALPVVIKFYTGGDRRLLLEDPEVVVQNLIHDLNIVEVADDGAVYIDGVRYTSLVPFKNASEYERKVYMFVVQFWRDMEKAFRLLREKLAKSTIKTEVLDVQEELAKRGL